MCMHACVYKKKVRVVVIVVVVTTIIIIIIMIIIIMMMMMTIDGKNALIEYGDLKMKKVTKTRKAAIILYSTYEVSQLAGSTCAHTHTHTHRITVRRSPALD